MTDPDIQTLVDDIPLHLSPKTLRARTRALVRRYVQRRSPQLAQAVVHHSQALSLHPALHDQPDEIAAYCRLTRHWRLLAAQCPAGMGA